MSVNILTSPRFMLAKNEAELQEKMLRLQIAESKSFYFLTIYPTKNGVVAWYYDNSKPEVNVGNLKRS